MKLFSKNLLLLLIFAFSTAAAWAQESGPRSFTLEESIAYAIQHNASVKNERLNRGIAKAQVGETTAQGLPQISATGEMTHNVEIPVSFLPGAIAGMPEADYVPVQFGVPWQSTASLSVNQMIFNGSYFVGLRAAKVFRLLAEKNEKKAEVDVAEAVSLAYYGALVAEDRLALLQENYRRLDSLHRETKAMYENGFAEAIDVQRVKVNLNNVRTEYESVQRSLGINLSMLKFQMGLPVSTDIILGEDIDDFDVEMPLEFQEDFDYRNRIEYQQLQVNNELAELDIRNNVVQYYPTLNAFFNYGFNAGKPTLDGLFQETPDIQTTMDGQPMVIEGRTWNPYASVGLRLNVPIFDGLLKANRIRRTRLEKEKVENQIQNLENSIELELQQARINLQNSLASLKVQEENIELAREVFRVAKIKYQEGVGSNLEVIEAENAYKTAETNYYNALYEALVARVAYQKATGTLFQK